MRVALSVLLVVHTWGTVTVAYGQYERFELYKNNALEVVTVEGKVTQKKLIPHQVEWELWVDNDVYYYADRGGISCQGEGGWLYKNIEENDYIRFSYLPIYKRVKDIRCLVKLERKNKNK